MDTIGSRLREERDKLGMNQTDFAAVGGVQKRAQVNYEAGERMPDARYLAAVAGHGVDVLYVLTGHRPVTYPAHGPGATVTPIGVAESDLLTRDQVLTIVLDAMHQVGKALPSRTVFALVDAAMDLQREGVPVKKSAVLAQLKVVR